MYLKSSQNLNLISRQTARLGAKHLVLVCAKVLAQAGVLDVLEVAKVRVPHHA
jgi:SpoU rRNA methylase family enzyme